MRLDEIVAFDHFLGEPLVSKMLSEENSLNDDMVFEHDPTNLIFEFDEFTVLHCELLEVKLGLRALLDKTLGQLQLILAPVIELQSVFF